jgi:hypothetical protein
VVLWDFESMPSSREGCMAGFPHAHTVAYCKGAFRDVAGPCLVAERGED